MAKQGLTVKERFGRAWRLAGELPEPRRSVHRAQLAGLAKRAVAAIKARPEVGADTFDDVFGGLPGWPTKTKPADVPQDQWDWDLALANELEKIYNATADSAKNVGSKALDGAAKVVHDVVEPAAVGAGVLLLGAAALLYVWKKR